MVRIRFKTKVALSLILILLTLPVGQIANDVIDDGIITAPTVERKIEIVTNNANYQRAAIKVAIKPVKAINAVIEEIGGADAKRAGDTMWQLIGQAAGVEGGDLETVLDNYIVKLGY